MVRVGVASTPLVDGARVARRAGTTVGFVARSGTYRIGRKADGAGEDGVTSPPLRARIPCAVPVAANQRAQALPVRRRRLITRVR